MTCTGTSFCKDVHEEKFLLHFELCMCVGVCVCECITFEHIQTLEYFVSESHSMGRLRIEMN